MGALPDYFIGVGDLKFAKLDPNGLPLAFVDMGESPQVEWGATVEYAEAFSTGKAGPNLMNLHAAIKRSGVLTIMATEKLIATAELFFHGTKSSEAAGSYTTNEAFPSGISVGESYLAPGGHVGISALVIKDSAGAPATLVNGTDYTYTPAGLVTFLNLGAYVQPFKAFSYSYQKSTTLKILSQTPGEVAVFFDGFNLAPTGEKIRAIFDRISLAPAQKIALKAGSNTGTANQPQDYSLTGTALLGQGKTATDGYGTWTEY